MKFTRKLWLGLFAVAAAATVASTGDCTTATTETQHPLHHGRRHRLDAVGQLFSSVRMWLVRTAALSNRLTPRAYGESERAIHKTEPRGQIHTWRWNQR
jgi:hypothetical protein